MGEIDEEVVGASVAFLPSICKGAFDSPRTKLVIADAIEWVKTATETFDVIIVDRSDCIGPGVGLYDKEFYRNCKRLMTPNGIFVAQAGILTFNQPYLEQQLMDLSQVWRKSSFYLSVVPTYAGGFLTILWAADWNITNVPDLEFDFKLANITDLQYYNVNIHKAAFALPTFARVLT
jgi:spermidine synthase